MSDCHDDDTFADLPGGLSLSESKLRLLQPELFGWRGWLTTTRWAGDILTSAGTHKMIAEHLFSGDANPAFVVTTEPDVVVAAYTDELDAIVLLRFDPFWTDLLHLVPDCGC